MQRVFLLLPRNGGELPLTSPNHHRFIRIVVDSFFFFFFADRLRTMETLISSKIHRLSLVNRSSHAATQLPSVRGPVLEFFSFFFLNFRNVRREDFFFFLSVLEIHASCSVHRIWKLNRTEYKYARETNEKQGNGL